MKGAYMGVMISDMDPQFAAIAGVYGLPVGPIIQSTEEGGPAQKAGIQAGDIILKLGSAEISSVAELTRVLRSYEPGDTTTIQVYREGSPLELKITFVEKPASAAEVPQQTEPASTEPSEEENPFGGNWPFGGND